MSDLDPRDRDAARPLSLAAVIENHDDDILRAQTLAAQALTLAPDDPVVLANLAHWQWDNVSRAKAQDAEVSAYLADTLRFGEAALRLDPENLIAYEFVFEAQRELGDELAAVRTLMEAYERSPRSMALNLTIGRFLAETANAGLARPFLERVLS